MKRTSRCILKALSTVCTEKARKSKESQQKTDKAANRIKSFFSIYITLLKYISQAQKNTLIWSPDLANVITQSDEDKKKLKSSERWREGADAKGFHRAFQRLEAVSTLSSWQRQQKKEDNVRYIQVNVANCLWKLREETACTRTNTRWQYALDIWVKMPSEWELEWNDSKTKEVLYSSNITFSLFL